jgi:cardiolipin synthase (CMP-forming)
MPPPSPLPRSPPQENIYNLPNALSATRLVLSPFIGWWIVDAQYQAALAAFGVAAVTDLLDGWLARRWRLQTAAGSVLDPLADKTLMTTMTVTLATQGLVPVPLAAMIIVRDVGLVGAASYYRYRSLISRRHPITTRRFFDPTIPSVQLHPTTISKWNTAFQVALMGGTLAGKALLDITAPHPALDALQALVAVTTVWSALSYVTTKDTVKFLLQRRRRRRNKDKGDGDGDDDVGRR